VTAKRVESAALLVRSVPYGEADIVATFFTEEGGKLAAIVRGARKSSKRFAGALEPIHELFVTLEDKGKELCVLKEARIGRARTGITSDLDAMEAAGQALRWVRHLCPVRTPEPAAWRSLRVLLDALDDRTTEVLVGQSLASFGLRLLADVGYALELGQCVRCGRPCPEGRSAYVDAAGGGLVCSNCGGARRTVSAEMRRAASGLSRGEDVVLTRGQVAELVEIIEDALAAHTDFDR
jgi:DNA repair protein RecO (recombination protein O)